MLVLRKYIYIQQLYLRLFIINFPIVLLQLLFLYMTRVEKYYYYLLLL